jgi:integrase
MGWSYVTYLKETAMSPSILVIYSLSDQRFASLLDRRLHSEGYVTLCIDDADKSESAFLRLESVIPSSIVLVLISPDGARSDFIVKSCALARHHNRQLIPLLIAHTSSLPWYIEHLQIEDFTDDFDRAFSRLLDTLPVPDRTSPKTITFGEARDLYLQRATLKSGHTVDSYRRAAELFLDFLAERKTGNRLPIQQVTFVTPDDIALTALSENDAPILLHFAQWLLSPSSGKTGDRRPYKPATVELRIAGVQNWFQFLDDHGWLPADFKLAKAKRIVRDELSGRPSRSGPPRPPDHIEEAIYYYDTLQPPANLRKPDIDPDRPRRWELTRLRNRALLHALAETGGRISELLSLNLNDFPERYLHQREVLRVEVMGKGGHAYYLRFFDSLPAIRDYIHARGADLRANLRGEIPLFISHDPRYDGNRMSRIVAWRIVQRAARALGLHSITPHDFRHWRATQLINAGHSLDVVQDYLGHRSVETTRSYYAHTDPLRVDDAAKNTGLPDPDNNRSD